MNKGVEVVILDGWREASFNISVGDHMSRMAIAITLLLWPAAAGADEPLLILVAREAIQLRLIDPQSARFEMSMRVENNGNKVVCGTINAKNRSGDYDGPKRFLYDPPSHDTLSSTVIIGGEAISNGPATAEQIKRFEVACT
jgi:hypothetical protein